MKAEVWEKFSKVKVLIVGDIMLDRYWWGKVERISPEAPVPVVNLEKTSLVAGGAANVAANVAGLGAKPFLIGLTGTDEEAALFPEVLLKNNVSADFLIKSSNRPTTVKTRIVAHNQQIVRIDQETKTAINQIEEEELWKSVERVIDEIDIIIVSDYGKGTISTDISVRLITSAKRLDKKILIDPKGKNYAKYRGATMLTPNRFEVAEAEQLENFGQQTIEEAGQRLISELSLESILITQGEEGMTLVEKSNRVKHISVTARNVYDVTGAGDTVIASLGVAIGSGENLLAAAKFANESAGLVVEQIGTTAISKKMFDNKTDEKFSRSNTL